MANGPRRYRQARYVQAWQVRPNEGEAIADWCGGEWDDELQQLNVDPSMRFSSQPNIASVGDWVICNEIIETTPNLLEAMFFVVSSEGFRRSYESTSQAEPKPNAQL